MNYGLQSIDASSIAYSVEQLESGQGLAHLLLRTDLHLGRVQAFLPSDDPLAAAGFSDGSLRGSEQESEAIRLLAEHLVNSYGLTQHPELLLIGQFPEGAKRREQPGSDAVADSDQTAYLTAWLVGANPAYYNGELWYVDKSSTLSAVERLLHDLLWFPAVAVLAKAPEGRHPTKDSEISLESLSVLVERPHAILIGAWDAMNYLFWSPVTEASKPVETEDA
jgi:hypothetical protein